MTPETNRRGSDIEWGDEMARREDEGGGFPGVTGALVRRSRGGVLALIPTEFKDWAALRNAIRPEVPRVFVEQLERGLRTDNLGAAMEAAWRAVVHDLRQKVVRLGLERFAALEGMPVLRTVEDLEVDVTEHRLLKGSRELQLLDEEAYVQLSHCRALITGYMASARFQSEPDRLDALNFVKNCTKYCLAVDAPAPGIDIQKLMDLVESEDLHARVDELERALSENPVVVSTIVRLLFRRFVGPGVEAQADANILRLFPMVWGRADDETKRAIGEEFESIRMTGTNDHAERAFSLLRLVRGASYLPSALLTLHLKQASQSLLEAHNGWKNFHHEARPARELFELGPRVPEQVRDVYVRSVAICYLGNPYGASEGALPHLEAMLKELDAQLTTRLFELLRNDPDVRSTLMSKRPAARLPGLLTLVDDRISRPEDRALGDRLAMMTPDEVVAQFARRVAA